MGILSAAARTRFRTARRTGFLYGSQQAYNSAGKLKNFRYDTGEVEAQKSGLAALRELGTLQELVGELGPLASYLAQAELVLPGDDLWIQEMQAARGTLLAELSTPAQRTATGFRQQASARLGALKQQYINRYAALHSQARLGVSEDQRKAALMQDARLRQLDRLATIELLPVGQLRDFKGRLAELRSCFALTEQELQSSPVCPHCGYRPVNEPQAGALSSRLRALDDELGRLLADWIKTLLDNLDDPVTWQNLSLMRPEQRTLIESFLKARKLPEPLSAAFLDAVREALAGLTRIELHTAELRAALLGDGAPARLDDIQQRFQSYLDSLARGKDRDKVRVVVE